jgi:peroxiredoxin (alkyl hydroperoxide reductase subunit C)
MTFKVHFNNYSIMDTQLYNMPLIGDPAPDFEAVTTIGKLKFSDYIKGKWTILFSHPADFTPVCTTELTGFAKEKDYFEQHNTKLIGLSIDSIHSHIAWVNNVREKTGVLFHFPIIADIDMKVAKLYGMLQPNASETAAVRAVFFIDPNAKIRLIMYYPLNVGRNMEEIKRVLEAMQTADEYKVALPLNWKKGEKVIVPPPKTMIELEERLASNLEMVDFYLAKKELV